MHMESQLGRVGLPVFVAVGQGDVAAGEFGDELEMFLIPTARDDQIAVGS